MKTNTKNMKIVLASLLGLILLLIIALLANLFSIAGANARARDAENQLQIALWQAEQNRLEIEYRSSTEFIDRYARENNMHQDGETVFAGR